MGQGCGGVVRRERGRGRVLTAPHRCGGFFGTGRKAFRDSTVQAVESLGVAPDASGGSGCIFSQILRVDN